MFHWKISYCTVLLLTLFDFSACQKEALLTPPGQDEMIPQALIHNSTAAAASGESCSCQMRIRSWSQMGTQTQVDYGPIIPGQALPGRILNPVLGQWYNLDPQYITSNQEVQLVPINAVGGGLGIVRINIKCDPEYRNFFPVAVNNPVHFTPRCAEYCACDLTIHSMDAPNAIGFSSVKTNGGSVVRNSEGGVLEREGSLVFPLDFPFPKLKEDCQSFPFKLVAFGPSGPVDGIFDVTVNCGGNSKNFNMQSDLLPASHVIGSDCEVYDLTAGETPPCFCNCTVSIDGGHAYITEGGVLTPAGPATIHVDIDEPDLCISGEHAPGDQFSQMINVQPGNSIFVSFENETGGSILTSPSLTVNCDGQSVQVNTLATNGLPTEISIDEDCIPDDPNTSLGGF